jgi:imidazole glycerol-phosphate synthase subunit HisH
MKLVIINYGAGNIQSIRFAFERLGCQASLSDDPEIIASADKVIFPGVGEASSAMQKLRASGLDRLIPKLEQPLLGICLGMQLMCGASQEGNTKGLGIFAADVLKFDHGVKVPQIGWNEINSLGSPLFRSVPESSFIYMVHSYYAPLCEQTIARSEYGLTYSAALCRDNFYGVQFHPEKSSDTGEKILKNFLSI